MPVAADISKHLFTSKNPHVSPETPNKDHSSFPQRISWWLVVSIEAAMFSLKVPPAQRYLKGQLEIPHIRVPFVSEMPNSFKGVGTPKTPKSIWFLLAKADSQTWFQKQWNQRVSTETWFCHRHAKNNKHCTLVTCIDAINKMKTNLLSSNI